MYLFYRYTSNDELKKVTTIAMVVVAAILYTLSGVGAHIVFGSASKCACEANTLWVVSAVRIIISLSSLFPSIKFI